MTGAGQTNEELRDLLWQSLEGGSVDVEELKERMQSNSQFEEFGLDSLDMTDFFLRVQDHYKVKIRQEDYEDLVSLAAVEKYVDGQDAATGQN